MYNMYSWDQPANSADEHTEPSAVATTSSEKKNGKAATGKTFPAVHAVQVALDRRDNGGDASPRRGQ